MNRLLLLLLLLFNNNIVVVTVIVVVDNFVHCLDLCTNDFYHTPLQEDLLCLADREGKQVECVGAGLR